MIRTEHSKWDRLDEYSSDDDDDHAILTHHKRNRTTKTNKNKKYNNVLCVIPTHHPNQLPILVYNLTHRKGVGVLNLQRVIPTSDETPNTLLVSPPDE